jgi:hypothetical protein
MLQKLVQNGAWAGEAERDGGLCYFFTVDRILALGYPTRKGGRSFI